MKLKAEGNSSLVIDLQFLTVKDLLFVIENSNTEFYIRNGDLYISERSSNE